jgi:hypothetical protein
MTDESGLGRVTSSWVVRAMAYLAYGVKMS